MKRLIFSFLLTCSFCFSYSADLEPNLFVTWELHNSNKLPEAIDFLTFLIQDTDVPDLDKIHYLVARSVFHTSQQDLLSYIDDIRRLKELAEQSPECIGELFSYYEISFLQIHP